jgi:hypothetical protein
MENITHTKQPMTYESRLALVANNFTKKMGLLYIPHVALKDNREGAGVYLQEIAETINSNLPSSIPNNDCYISALRDVWRLVVARHKSRYWFSLSDCHAAAKKVGADCHRAYGRKEDVKTYGNEMSHEDKARVKGSGWTEIGARKALAETDALIASGELNRGMGLKLRRMPIVALQRMGVEVDETPPALALPKPEPKPLPPKPEAVKAEPLKPLMDMDSSALNMRLIRSGAIAPTFDPNEQEINDDLPDALQAEPSGWDSL